MAITLGNVQFRIMRVLWDDGECTAREVTEKLNATAPIAHSTVQTLLRKLEAKRAVGHRRRDRSFVFRAVVSEGETTRSAAQEMLARVFGGSVSGLVAHLLEGETVSAEELARLRALVEEKAREEGR